MTNLTELPPSSPPKIKGGPIRKSKRSRWRAASLIGLHVAILVHVAHWKLSGSTLTPVEPSEAMQTLELGYVNAGFILFCVLLLATLVLGRFFCGWACHVVAYQDGSTWLLGKLGIRPRAIRSRLLMWIPLGAALYMFVWPQVKRLVWEPVTTGDPAREFPELTNHLNTQEFWATFPGFWMATTTLVVCGFLIVYWLGQKAFCTYGCPYGGFFGVADRFALGSIRVNDQCEGCGHCTASCTSNVDVRREVLTHGQVVDPGCMKCLDCVSVCPKDALSYRLGKPSILQKAPKQKAARRYDFTWPDELLLAVVFLGSLAVWRNLYGAVPFLLAIALSVLTAIATLTGARLLRRRDFRFQQWTLRQGGALTGAGFVALMLLLAWHAALAHSVYVRWHTWRGQQLFESATSLSREERRPVLRASLEHLETAERSGLFTDGDVQVQLAEITRYAGDFGSAERRFRRALAVKPELRFAWLRLADLLWIQNRQDEAIELVRVAAERYPDFAGARLWLEQNAPR